MNILRNVHPILYSIPHHSLFEVRMLYILAISPVSYGNAIALFFLQSK